jgi:hypothetical protein
MTPIADMIEQMAAGGVSMEMILVAVRTAELSRVSGGKQVDTAAEKRRAWDREYRAKRRTVHPNPPENPPDTKNVYIDNLPSNNKSKKTISRGSPLPPDWMPDEQGRAYAKDKKSWNDAKIDFEAERFRNHSLSKGILHKNINAAWRNWVTSPYQTGGPGGQVGRNSGGSRGGSLLDAIDEMRAGLAADKNADVVQFLPARSVPGPEGIHGPDGDGLGAVRRPSGGDRHEPTDWHPAQAQVSSKYRGSG